MTRRRRTTLEGMERVPLASRELVTVRGKQSAVPLQPGALVRYFPPARETSAETEQVVQVLRNAGAAAVRVQAPEKDDAVLTRKDVTPGLRQANATVRDVVLELAKGAKNVDCAQLKQALDEVLTEVGL